MPNRLTQTYNTSRTHAHTWHECGPHAERQLEESVITRTYNYAWPTVCASARTRFISFRVHTRSVNILTTVRCSNNKWSDRRAVEPCSTQSSSSLFGRIEFVIHIHIYRERQLFDVRDGSPYIAIITHRPSDGPVSSEGNIRVCMCVGNIHVPPFPVLRVLGFSKKYLVSHINSLGIKL